MAVITEFWLGGVKRGGDDKSGETVALICDLFPCNLSVDLSLSCHIVHIIFITMNCGVD